MSLPSLFRHENKQLGAVCHVDDLIVAGQLMDLEWLLEVMKKRFVLSESGILPREGQSPEEAVRCLKKRHFFPKDGLVVSISFGHFTHPTLCAQLVPVHGAPNKEGRD